MSGGTRAAAPAAPSSYAHAATGTPLAPQTAPAVPSSHARPPLPVPTGSGGLAAGPPDGSGPQGRQRAETALTSTGTFPRVALE